MTLSLGLLSPLLLISPSYAQPKTPDKNKDFFQKTIRPLLVQTCVSCHGPDRPKGGLDLSTRAALLEGGTHGPSIVPGKPDESLLYKKVAKGEMPPKKQLSPQEVAAFKQWIQAGAPFEGPPLVTAKAAKTKIPWSFQPIVRPPLPKTKFDGKARTSIDNFIFHKLEKKGLEPNPVAEKLALLRRVTFDLTGLPPTPEVVDNFLGDATPQAYEKVVDRLLASPAFGERWARHWLDVVRYGESNGYEQNHVRVNAWPYRDYVIQAFNEDKPFDVFLTEQLAGDALGSGNPQVEVATGFLVAGVHDTVGNSTEEGRRQQRINDLEDIVSTVGASFLGLTIGCARCHDHKFDPVSQKEFYQLTAVFAGVRHGERSPEKITLSPEQAKHGQDLDQRRRYLRNIIDELDALARHRILQAQGSQPILRPAISSRRNVDDFPAVQAKFVRLTIQATHDDAEPCIDEIEIFGPDGYDNLALASRGAKPSASSLLPGFQVHQISHLNDGKFGNNFSWLSKDRGKGWAQIELAQPSKIARVVWARDSSEPARYTDRTPSAYHLEISTDGKAWQLVASHKDRATAGESVSLDAVKKALTAQEMMKRDLLFKELDNLRQLATVTQAPKFYIGQFGTPEPIFFLKRGDVMQRGDLVTAAALAQIPGLPANLDADLLKTEPGRRLALARWLTHPKNPLTARVIVNRLWQYHFGRGLVPTPSDFGHGGSSPSHPELLDWLASDLMANSWRLKRLHRLMVTSHAYQQASKTSDRAQALDADNVLLGRMPLRRMEAETLRDSILAVSGKLDTRRGGPGFALFKYKVLNVAIYDPLEQFGPETWRRTVYSLSPRAIREDLLATFDCPESAQRTPRRDVTTTPLQALSLLNSPFTLQQARFFAERLQKEVKSDVPGQISHAFRLAFNRPPTPDELTAARDIVQRHGLPTLCRTLFNANEFIYY
jgi:mono/diheme cytochrome c family protein